MNTNENTTTTRVDLHCHSTASAVAKLGVSRALGLPECATPPEEVYELAKRRGMDFVTITDHDVIDGAAELAERYDDAFVSVELTARFARSPQAVHVLCWGITPADHDELQRLAGDVEDVAGYLAEHKIATALAHPFFNVGAPLQAAHRRRLAELFGAWEVRNGARAPELNAPAALYIDTRGGTGTGGSDDHAGVDIGRTWTQAPPAADWRGFLEHIRAGRVTAGGDEGSASKWAHAALAIAIRTLGRAATADAPDVAAVLAMAQQVAATDDVLGRGLTPDDARALVTAWLDAVGVDEDPIALLQRDGHAGLAHRARRVHERALREAAEAPIDGTLPVRVFKACLPAVPYVPAAAFQGREIGRLAARREGERPRVAIVADGIGATHGVARTLEQIRSRGVPGFDVELIGTDADVDRRLASVAEVDLGGVSVGVPSLPAVVEALAERRYDLIHVTAPGPAGIAAAVVSQVTGLPLVGSYHTELAAYAGLRTGDQRATVAMTTAVLSAFYGRCARVLSPSAPADVMLANLGIPAAALRRWDRGVDLDAFPPGAERQRGRHDRVDVLYAGRLAAEKGTELLADAFLRAREQDPRLHLVLAGGGAEEARLRARLGEHATFLGWLDEPRLAAAYADADLFCFCSETDTFGQVILEAQASGLPVVVVDAGGPAELVQDGRTGVKCPPDPQVIANALVGLARSRRARDRLRQGALAAVRTRTWERSLTRLAEGWSDVLTESARRAA